MLYSAGYHIALWNALFDSYVNFDKLEKEYFSEEEWEFIQKANEKKQRNKEMWNRGWSKL